MKEKEIIYPAGSYVVLVKAGSGRNDYAMPTGYCYKLREDYIPGIFRPEKDILNSGTNGWSYTSPEKLKVRLAGRKEIEEYIKLGKPCDVDNLYKEEIIDNYLIY